MKLFFPGYCYCIDTSALIDLKPYYPDVFPSLWKNIEQFISQGRLIAPCEVLYELEKYGDKDDELLKWAKKHKKMFKGLDNEQINQMRDIVRNFRNFVDINKTTPEADPFVIALAISEGCTVVTSEQPAKLVANLVVNPSARPKIPDVCEFYKVKWLPLSEFFREQKWKF